MKVLIAGGAGYVGSTIASAYLDEDIEIVVLDNLVTGRREFAKGRTFYEGDIANRGLVTRILEEHPDIDVAILCAALINVSESYARPKDYYRNNVVKCLGFIDSLMASGCTRLIFSSSASIYRSSEMAAVDERAPLEPTSPYARSKTAFEWIVEDISHAGPLRVISFRFFNPIGADPQMRTGLQSSETSHALGAMIRAMTTETDFAIMGTDYATRDGTGIRDYVHVWDIARAHISAVQLFDSIVSVDNPYEAINLGTGRGTTVRELVHKFNKVSPIPIHTVNLARRDGDAAGAFSNFEKATRLLGWTPILSLEDGIRDSLRWAKMRRGILGD